MADTLNRLAETRMPTSWGNFQLVAYGPLSDNRDKPILVLHHLLPDSDHPPLLRIHSECMTGDVFGSLRCDCGQQLDAALKRIATEGGLLIYLRQEGRGIGLVNKLHAYNLQDEGLDTAQANEHLGFEIDARSYKDAVSILRDMGIDTVRLLTNNPDKISAFENSGIDVTSREALVIPANTESEKYLKTKRDRLGHLL